MTILIHPGFHKTGTTWLQYTAFADKRYFNRCLDHESVDELIVRPHDFDFDPEPARQLLARSINDDPTPNILSCELLTGNPFNGLRDAGTLADRLFAICPDARILLTVRRQEQMVRAVYQQYLKSGGLLKLRDFLTQSSVPGFYGFTKMAVQYDKIAARYAELFGTENVLVLPHEMLLSSQPAFFEALARFTGTDPAGPDFADDRRIAFSPPAGGNPVMRFANRWWSSPVKPDSFTLFSWFARQTFRAAYRQKLFSDRIKKADMKIIRAYLGDEIRAHNAALQKWCPAPLD